MAASRPRCSLGSFELAPVIRVALGNYRLSGVIFIAVQQEILGAPRDNRVVLPSSSSSPRSSLPPSPFYSFRPRSKLIKGEAGRSGRSIGRENYNTESPLCATEKELRARLRARSCVAFNAPAATEINFRSRGRITSARNFVARAAFSHFSSYRLFRGFRVAMVPSLTSAEAKRREGDENALKIVFHALSEKKSQCPFPSLS